MRVFVASGAGVLERAVVSASWCPGSPAGGDDGRGQAGAVGADGVVKAGGTVLRHGALYGPGATGDQVELVRERRFPLVGARHR